jgi:hypothetical protein
MTGAAMPTPPTSTGLDPWALEAIERSARRHNRRFVVAAVLTAAGIGAAVVLGELGLLGTG